MLTRRRITLLNGTADLAPVIDRAQITVHEQGTAMRQQAEQQAEQIIAAARQEAEVCKQRARQQVEEAFWQQADSLFERWQQQQQQSESAILTVMDDVLAQALAQLLSEVPEPQRIHALLRQLLREKVLVEQTSLCCHPSQQPMIAVWLASHSHLCWHLQPDDNLPIDGLRLITQQGELYLDWSLAVRKLQPQSE